MIAEIDRTEWEDIYKHSGLSPEHLEKLAQLFLESERSIFCWEWVLLNTATEQPMYIC